MRVEINFTRCVGKNRDPYEGLRLSLFRDFRSRDPTVLNRTHYDIRTRTNGRALLISRTISQCLAWKEQSAIYDRDKYFSVEIAARNLDVRLCHFSTVLPSLLLFLLISFFVVLFLVTILHVHSLYVCVFLVAS